MSFDQCVPGDFFFRLSNSELNYCTQAHYPLAIADFVAQVWAGNLDAGADAAKPKPMTTSLTNWGVLPLRAHYGPHAIRGARPLVNMIHAPYPVFLATTCGANGQLRCVRTHWLRNCG